MLLLLLLLMMNAAMCGAARYWSYPLRKTIHRRAYITFAWMLVLGLVSVVLFCACGGRQMMTMLSTAVK
jgi:hypothetical protein